VEQGKTRWPESTVQAERDLGDPHSTAHSKPMSKVDDALEMAEQTDV
jgi:hypothetical protein